MIIGIVTVKSHRYHPNKRLLAAAKHLKHHAVLIHPKNFFMGVGDQGLGIEHLRGRFSADVILPRLGAPIKEFGLTMVRHFELCGIPVINNFESILLARNKFLTLQTLFTNGIPVPPSRYASNWFNFEKAVSNLGGLPLVVKTRNSRQGSGVFLVHSLEESRPVLDPLLNKGQGILIQRYIPLEERRDLRLLVVGQRVVGGISLKPRRGDFRANIHLNALAEAIHPSQEMCALAAESARALGLDIAGVDMIEEGGGMLRVIDVNYSPGFKGLERCTGKDVASEIIRYVLKSKR